MLPRLAWHPDIDSNCARPLIPEKMRLVADLHRTFAASLDKEASSSLVHTLGMGIPSWTLCVRPAASPHAADAERRRRHSATERRNEDGHSVGRDRQGVSNE